MSTTERYRKELEVAWSQLEARMQKLPPRLAVLGGRFIHELAKSGQSPIEYFVSPLAAPLVFLPLWMRDALRRRGEWPESPTSNAAVENVLVAAMWGYFYIRIQDDFLDETVALRFQREHMLLANVCIGESAKLMAETNPNESAFATAFERAWLEFSARTLDEYEQLTSDREYTAELFIAHAAKVAFARVPMLALCARVGELESLEGLVSEFVHSLGVACGLMNDVRGWKRDVANGHRTYLLACAGWTLFGKERTGSTVLTGAELEVRLYEQGLLSEFLSKARCAFEQALRNARALGFEEEFEHFCQERSQLLEEMQQSLFSIALLRALRRPM